MGHARRTIETRPLAPRVTDRVRSAWHATGWARTMLLRRTAAGVLVVLAAVLALTPQEGSGAGVAVVVAERDLAPGLRLDASMLGLRERPPDTVPAGAARSVPELTGRLLAAPLRRGEPVTDVRLAGPTLARAVARDPAAVSVPLQLSNPEVAALLHPGARVDVVTLGPQAARPLILARAASVVAVLRPQDEDAAEPARLVLIALAPKPAARVAAASLSQPVTVTVR